MSVVLVLAKVVPIFVAQFPEPSGFFGPVTVDPSPHLHSVAGITLQVTSLVLV